MKVCLSDLPPIWDRSIGLYFTFQDFLQLLELLSLEHVSALIRAEEPCRVLGKLQSRTKLTSLVPLLHSCAVLFETTSGGCFAQTFIEWKHSLTEPYSVNWFLALNPLSADIVGQLLLTG